MDRKELLATVAARILDVDCSHPIRVGIDGIDAAGKSTFAEEIEAILTSMGKNVLRSSVDYFHHPREIRHKRSSESPLSYYEDSFDYQKVRSYLLMPLGPGGNRTYRTAAYDFTVEQAVESEARSAVDDSILVFEGIFLFRPELLPYWDLKIFLDIRFETSLLRATQRKRDQQLFGDVDDIAARYKKRYIPGQKIYFERCQPQEHADILIDHNDPLAPKILRI